MSCRKLMLALGAVLFFAAGGVLADWIPGDGHKMHWPQLPDEQGWDVNALFPANLADDWQCSQSGPVSEVHFWGSWRDMTGDGIGDVGPIQSFTIRIWSDIPVDPPLIMYSRPGTLLWEAVVDSWAEVPIDPPTWEAWFDPFSGTVINNDHDAYFQYNVDFAALGYTPFNQVAGTIYWLSITADVPDDGTPFSPQWGWKSTIDHFNDDAVFTLEGNWGDWMEMYEPPRYNEFAVALDPSGNFIAGGGTNFYTDGTDENGWYYYPQFNWWNIWFYDNPFRADHFKQADLDMIIEPVDPTALSEVRIAVNFSTDVWSAGGLDRPPLPSDPAADETTNIGRMDVWTWDPSQGPLPPTGIPAQLPWTLSDYNPEWISIDVQGFNFQIRGNITHECVRTSLDLAFVINTADPTGACCFQDGTCTDGMTMNDCTAVGGTYLGDGSVCLGDNDGDGHDDACDPVVVDGACCLQDGTCLTTVPSVCASMGGTYLGDNSVCLGDADGNGVDDACETPAKKGACCWPDGTCSVVTAANCVQNGGTYLGDNTACLGDLDGNMVDDACETPDPDFKWEQLPDIDPTGFDVNATFTNGQPYVLADDFECTVTGPITRIHVYGSWFLDFMPPGGATDVQFVLSIHEDIPATPTEYSRPGQLLCLLTDLPFEVKPYATDLQEGWLNPPDQLHAFGDKICWEYTFFLPPDICIQEGTPTNPVVYWLDLQAYPNAEPGAQTPLFGWKSSLQHWNDDATWAFGQDAAGATLDWQEMIYPPNHPLGGESVDLAFKIIGSSGIPTPTGACCWPDGSCTVETQADCENSPFGISGTYLGDGSACLGDANANGVDDACEDPIPSGACCYDDPAVGPMCINTTQSNCITLGGAWYAGQDCNDATFNCPSQEPQGACCWTDAAGNMNCTTTTEGECLNAYGGTWYLGQDCSWFDCPTPQPLGACCYGPPSSPSCVNTTEDQCKTVYNGTWYPGQDCATFDCPVLVGVPLGACCYDDPIVGPSCINTSKKNCKKVLGGTWYPGQNCATFDCPTSDQPPKGACCYGDPANPFCINTTQSDCLTAYGGTWYLGQDCATLHCPDIVPLGACCYGDPFNPSCVDGITQLGCETQYGGNWYGGQTCATISCPTQVPQGACCYDDPVAGPSCIQTAQSICLQVYGGTFYWAQDCATFDCPTQEPLGACCYGDPASPSCVNTTQSDCLTAYGGTWYVGQDCATFDCPVPIETGACCYEDAAGNQACVNTTQLDCQAVYGGSWYAGQTCATIDCPQILPLGACCYEIPGAAPGCITTSQADCYQTYGGTWYAGQDCSTVDCGHQAPLGACCYGDPASPSCINTTHADCLTAYGGTWYANADCATFTCPVPVELGACCVPGANGPFCVDNTPQYPCEVFYGGTWYGSQTCATVDCVTADPIGACCYQDAIGAQACANTTQVNCTQAYGGTWYAGQDCASFTCPTADPTGACCWPDGSCTIETMADCENPPGATGGSYLGDGTVCLGDGNVNGIDDACEDAVALGACCWPDGSCTVVTEANCLGAANPGTYNGDGSLCIGDLDGNGVDDACEDPQPEWKWLQPPDLEPTGVDVRISEPLILADDFLCTQPGDIGEVSIWTSWWHDELPQGAPENVSFTLSLHTDVPATHIAIPVPECPSGGDGWDIIDGLPGGTSILGHGRLTNMNNVALQGGGVFGPDGTITTFTATLELQMNNNGVPGFGNRHLFVQVNCEVHTGKPQPGDDVQNYPTEMVSLQGELFGDPDFCVFRVQSGSDFGLPSPGHTTLTRLEGGDFQVDSFFDIEYRIEFQGCPGSALEGFGGTTEGTTRMDTPEAGGPLCITPNLGQHSTPGVLLCLQTFDVGDFRVEEVVVTEEDWFDPSTGLYESPGDHNCFKYTFRFDPGECVQEGTEVDPIVYWLDVQARPVQPDTYIGWKTSRVHWNDDATWNVGTEPVSTPWQELRYPNGHPFSPRSLDLAFEVRNNTGCCVGPMRGDANNSGDNIPTIGDISVMIDALFITGACGANESPPVEMIPCLAEADVNESSPTPGAETCADLSIGDISMLVDFLFITGPANWDQGYGLMLLAPCP